MPLSPSNYPIASNAELFRELERLTILCENVQRTVDKLAIQDNCAPQLVYELKLYHSTQSALKKELQYFIISTRKA